MEHVVSESVGQPRLMSALTGLFGALAGLLAMVGVYGVMAYNVRRQRREFGIRLALGAEQTRIKALVVIRGLSLAAVGVALGGLGAWMLTPLLKPNHTLSQITSKSLDALQSNFATRNCSLSPFFWIRFGRVKSPAVDEDEKAAPFRSEGGLRGSPPLPNCSYDNSTPGLKDRHCLRA